MIHFDDKTIRHTTSYFEKNWSIPELFENSKALDVEPLADQNSLFRQLIPFAEKMTADLSETARLPLDFWKNLDPERIASRNFSYTLKISDSYQWSLKINGEGLFYTDISACYSSLKNAVTPQLLSDFWFYGPSMPIPELETRKTLLAIIREAFIQKNTKSYDAHFQFFEYPKRIIPRSWEFGDYVVSDFVNMRDFGVDYGRQNFHDGLVGIDFISFEQCLYCPVFAKRALGEDIFLNDIKEAILAECFSGVLPVPGILMPDVLEPDIQNSTSPKTIAEVVLQTPKTPTARERQDSAEALLNSGKINESADVLLELLSEDDPDHYWRNYVFNMLFKMRESPRAQAWIAQCLQGNDEIYFKKAVDVLFMWGMRGDKILTDKPLLNVLRWENKLLGTDEFREALKKILKNWGLPVTA